MVRLALSHLRAIVRPASSQPYAMVRHADTQPCAMASTPASWTHPTHYGAAHQPQLTNNRKSKIVNRKS